MTRTYKILTVPYLVEAKDGENLPRLSGFNNKGYFDDINVALSPYWYSCRCKNDTIIIFNDECCIPFDSETAMSLFDIIRKVENVNTFLKNINIGLDSGVKITI